MFCILFQKCDKCNRSGATVGCNTRGCTGNYHFMCARKDDCVFQEDKKVFCKLHRDRTDGEVSISAYLRDSIHTC